MLFQVLDVDYTIVNELPVIRIFGKSDRGKPVCGFFEGNSERYLPYFYVDSEMDINKVLEGETNVHKTERVKRFLPIGYHKEKKDVWKIFLKNPAKTPELRDRLKAKGFDVYEADIPFKYRFMTDFGIRGMDWIEVENEVPVNTNTVNVESKIVIKKIKTTERELSDLKYLAFDIECVPLKPGSVPDEKYDPVIMISLVFSEPYKGKKSMVISTRPGKGVTSFETEKEMLEGFVKIMMEYDPDILTGFNVKNFDIPYILERMRQNEIVPMFGRCKKQVTANKVMSRYRVNLTGRIIADSFEIVKRDFSMKRYDLNTVSENLLNENKEDVKHSEIDKLWKGSQDGYEKLVTYCLKDSKLAMSLLLKLNLLDKYFALAKTSGTLMQDILDSGETMRIENVLLNEFNKNGFILPCRPEGSDVAKREKQRIIELKGGFVIEPKKGLHSSVIVLDFKSMYPSLIRTFNICPTTLIIDEDMENSIMSPAGAKFVPESVRKGIIPSILEGLMKERGDVKKRLKVEKDPQKKKGLDAKQWALKILSNAFYGHFGYPRAKIYKLEIANSITSFGRETIARTKEFIEKKYGYEVVYGDTDSVMVKIDKEDLEEIKKIGDSISRDVTKNLKGVMELEFEKVFKRFLPLTKKRYAAWCFELTQDGWKDKIETKGIETVRRDWCDLVSETTKRVLEIILKENDIKSAVKFFNGIVKEVTERKVSIQKLVITKTLTKRADGYAGVQPHAELAKKMKKRSPADAPGVGDRIGYVIIKGLDLVSKRTEDPMYVIERGLEIDSKYYIENQLLPPVERIFSALDVSKTELLGKGKQISLCGALNNFSGKPKKIEKVSLDEVNGLICVKCSKCYDMPPLTGLCECGGELMFSSVKGIARSVTV
ncbi:MAG: DNA polymerase elongation subunit [Candidatus Aenigmarchaeota archaeon]|nr:DNA polymerase elongation subunit [Candidatus Aenigmarchaeota archaeon]